MTHDGDDVGILAEHLHEQRKPARPQLAPPLLVEIAEPADRRPPARRQLAHRQRDRHAQVEALGESEHRHADCPVARRDRRFIAAVGPFLVGTVAARGADSLQTALGALFWVGVVPLLGAVVALTPVVIETKDRALA